VFRFVAMPHEDHHSSFRVMTYNIRLDTPRDGVNQWSLRKDRVASLIRYHEADLFGVQEALPHQMTDLKTALPAFDWYGAGRDDGKNKGEFSGIFYRSDRFELLDKDTFWLSKTPEIPGSKGWDADVTRVCSWVKLRDRWTLQTFYHFNTHFDHIGKTARRESARLIVTRIQNITKLNAPVILTGDFNTGPNSDAYRAIITNSTLQDAKDLTEIPHYGPNSTWSTFCVGKRLGDRIDYIFVTPHYLRTLHHAILTDSDSQYYPSDHLPVLAELATIMATRLN
jgi:endonuclease/exonuclease/phosphatase family metal-dependent hydrolase